MANMEHLSLVPPLSETYPDQAETGEHEPAAVYLEECSTKDEALLEFVATNRAATRQGNIDIDALTNLDHPQAWAYKIMKAAEEPGADDEIVGAAYALRKGMEHGSVQIMYVIASQLQGQGYGTEAVKQLTDQLTERYDVVAMIDKLNEPSKKVVQGLGYWAMGESRFDTSKEGFVRLKGSATAKDASRTA